MVASSTGELDHQGEPVTSNDRLAPFERIIMHVSEPINGQGCLVRAHPQQHPVLRCRHDGADLLSTSDQTTSRPAVKFVVERSVREVHVKQRGSIVCGQPHSVNGEWFAPQSDSLEVEQRSPGAQSQVGGYFLVGMFAHHRARRVRWSTGLTVGAISVVGSLGAPP